MEDSFVKIIVGCIVGGFLGRALAPFFVKSEEQLWEEAMAHERNRDIYPTYQMLKMRRRETKLDMDEGETKWDGAKEKLI